MTRSPTEAAYDRRSKLLNLVGHLAPLPGHIPKFGSNHRVVCGLGAIVAFGCPGSILFCFHLAAHYYAARMSGTAIHSMPNIPPGPLGGG